ncbi:hypothetical protein J1N35_012084 [Gossypium stocksii]|uniref:RNase H type-1 domain-containing protein n=1 Tax=Gossypium stocksii TaxID=47602 RepID=A0A9D4AE71_9ROSI|nr:hypothetical protein J1N35_012084 [Gossypium stocksii]
MEDTVRAAECFAANVYEANYKKKNRKASIEMIKWCPPNPRWIKVNLDGAANRNRDLSMAGGVFRDSFGTQIEGFQRVVGRGYAINSELWAILHGLEITLIRGHNKFAKREGNMVADWLAKTCPSTDVNLRILDVPTFYVRKLLLEDKFGVPYVKTN